MEKSEAYWFSFRGELATLFVVRNNGECWGEIDAPQGRFRVESQLFDMYDMTDVNASRLLVAASQDEANVAPSMLSMP